MRLRGTALLALALVSACSSPPPTAPPPDASATGPPSGASATAPPSTAPADIPVARVFPVLGGEASYGQSHHGYPATDIMANCGLTYVAPYSGIISEVTRVDRYDPRTNAGATRGGRSVSLLGDDGVRYYGSHFSAIEDGIEPGVRVAAGDPIATVGRSGDASACHVHFGLSPVCSDGDWFVRRGVIWPWPYLDSWRAGGNAEPRPEIEQWLMTDGCPDHPLVEP